jgi:hypothetical protein
MGFLLTLTGALVLWIVVWALGYSGLDSALLALAIIVVGATARILVGYLPGRRG